MIFPDLLILGLRVKELNYQLAIFKCCNAINKLVYAQIPHKNNNNCFWL